MAKLYKTTLTTNNYKFVTDCKTKIPYAAEGWYTKQKDGETIFCLDSQGTSRFMAWLCTMLFKIYEAAYNRFCMPV